VPEQLKKRLILIEGKKTEMAWDIALVLAAKGARIIVTDELREDEAVQTMLESDKGDIFVGLESLQPEQDLAIELIDQQGAPN
jgi:NAD(P)-dependent dehydrogenase (short-subunit alcohol dehydrogenase family)